MSRNLESVLRKASEDGALPIVFDTSPCAYRMKHELEGRLPVFDLTEFLHDHVLPRLSIRRQPLTVAAHPVCSVRKMELQDKLTRIAEACAQTVIVPDGVACCGWAGDRGFTFPELNAHALRHLKPALPTGCDVGYSTSRTCEIGLSDHAGIPYRSIVYLVDACSESR
jgi:D-lactate dehydrogenase